MPIGEHGYRRELLKRLDILIEMGRESIAVQKDILKAVKALQSPVEEIGDRFETPVPIQKGK